MIADRGRGKIINITTMAAHIGMPGAALYGASKAAVELLTKARAAEHVPRGVNVKCDCSRSGPHGEAAGLGDIPEQLAKLAPAGRVARPEEIAAAAVYLASEESDFVHGATLVIDGGRTAT